MNSKLKSRSTGFLGFVGATTAIVALILLGDDSAHGFRDYLGKIVFGVAITVSAVVGMGIILFAIAGLFLGCTWVKNKVKRKKHESGSY